jgi:hypothetical protein
MGVGLLELASEVIPETKKGAVRDAVELPRRIGLVLKDSIRLT